MSGTANPPPAAHTTTGRSRRLPVIWLIPVVAIAIGIWLAWRTLEQQGPTITISFDSAEGLQTGQSQLRFKDITLGTVTRLDLTADHSRVIATVATTRQATPLLTDQTVFWVVRPRLFAGNLSGLSTLLSGSYIGMMPSAKPGRPQRHFTGSEDPPILAENIPGRTFILQATRLGSISLGSPVFFHDLDVGEVLGWQVGDMAERVTMRVFVRAPYDKYVTTDTRFWNASGASLQLGSSGIQLEVASLRALLLGGVEFATPAGKAPTAAAPDTIFPLFSSKADADAASYTRKIPVISYFPGSVRGLGPGSEVTMHGLMVGHVKSVRLSYNAAKDAVTAPVEYELEPERVVGIGKKLYADPRVPLEAAVQRGLRASLESANLITGQQNVSLDFDANAPPATLTMEGQNLVLPTSSGGGFSGLAAAAAVLVNQVNTIPFRQIGDNLNGILHATNELTTDRQTHEALLAAAATLNSTKVLMSHLNNKLDPTLQKLPEIAAGLDKAMANINRLTLSLNNGYGGDTEFNRNLERLLVQLNGAVQSIRSLADLLTRHPEVLIKGRAGDVP
jgi:paraquat-inducible protein B